MSTGVLPEDGEDLCVGEIARAIVGNPFWDFWWD
jgi:hypothetical protein